MKTVCIHPFSVLTGALACALLVAVVGFRAPAAPAASERALLVHVETVPANHVRIMEGTPYLVPEGKALTLKLLVFAGSFPSPFGVNVQIDGVEVYFGKAEIPFGVTAFAGEVVTLTQPFPQMGNTAVGFGYLSD